MKPSFLLFLFNYLTHLKDILYKPHNNRITNPNMSKNELLNNIVKRKVKKTRAINEIKD